MSTKHTQEPWKVDESRPHLIVLPEKSEAGEGSKYVVCGGGKNEVNAARIVECVNAMAGIEKPQEFMGVVKKLELDAYQRVAAERDELKKVLEEAYELCFKVKNQFTILIDALKSIADMRPTTQVKGTAQEALKKIYGDGQNS